MQTLELLTKLGFTGKEAIVYTKLLEQPGLNYNQLSDAVKINRTTCYSVVKKLAKAGLVSENFGSNVVKLLASEPGTLLQIFQKKQEEAQKSLEVARRASLELQNIVPRHFWSEPTITYFGEPNVKEAFIARTKIWDKSLASTDGTIWGFQDSKFEQIFTDFIFSRKEIYNSKKIALKLFSDDPQYKEKFQLPTPAVQIRYWPNLISFEASFYVQGEYLVILSLEQSPQYMVEIKDSLLANNFRNFFHVIWQATENLPGLGQAS